jgi:hypothetical protein
MKTHDIRIGTIYRFDRVVNPRRYVVSFRQDPREMKVIYCPVTSAGYLLLYSAMKMGLEAFASGAIEEWLTPRANADTPVDFTI